ncbi:MAG TPA: S8 family serine peptidase, partial [Terriglobales bacterium]|nr:S8 family serine peptidase [Terriglobales bacterium]
MNNQPADLSNTDLSQSDAAAIGTVQVADAGNNGQPLYTTANGTPVYAFKEQDQLLNAQPERGQDGVEGPSLYRQSEQPAVTVSQPDTQHQLPLNNAGGHQDTTDHGSGSNTGADGLIQGVNYLTSTTDMIGWNLKSINLAAVRGEFTGKGVTVAIVDDGFNYAGNSDLTKNYNTALDWDFRNNDADARAEGTDFHGTMVDGLISAARNGTGTVGVAENATIEGLRVGFGAAGTISQMVNALLKASSADVVNNSWGYTSAFADDPNNAYFKGLMAAINTDVTSGRGGLGTSVVFAAGNARQSSDNTDFHGLQGNRDVITVASYNQTGDVSSFSTKGANMLLAAPGENVLTDYQNGLAYGSGTSFSAP